MDDRPEIATRRQASRRVALLTYAPVAVLFIVGLAAFYFSLREGAQSWQQVLYDVGLGLFTATAISAVLGLYLRSIEKRQERQDHAAEMERTEQQKHLDEQLDSLKEQAHEMQVKMDIVGLGRDLKLLATTVRLSQQDLLRRLGAVLRKVDPEYRDEVENAINEHWRDYVALMADKQDPDAEQPASE